MDGWLRMALHTFCRRTRIPLFRVALSALKLGMATIQWEKSGMVKVAHPVSAVVAIQAGVPELVAVSRQEICVLRVAGVAADTGLHVKSVLIAHVAGAAGQRLIFVIEAVTGEAETSSLLMLKGYAFQGCGFPAFSRMAINTILRVETLVDLRLAMAFNAIHRRVCERIALLVL